MNSSDLAVNYYSHCHHHAHRYHHERERNKDKTRKASGTKARNDQQRDDRRQNDILSSSMQTKRKHVFNFSYVITAMTKTVMIFTKIEFLVYLCVSKFRAKMTIEKHSCYHLILMIICIIRWKPIKWVHVGSRWIYLGKGWVPIFLLENKTKTRDKTKQEMKRSKT